MPDTATKIKTDEHGNVLLTKELVEELEPNTVYNIERQGRAIRLEPTPRLPKLHEIQDPEERVKAFQEFLKEFSKPSGGELPDWHIIQDSIYD
jgi:hypothetical protein